jgi:hypothetical protein
MFTPVLRRTAVLAAIATLAAAPAAAEPAPAPPAPPPVAAVPGPMNPAAPAVGAPPMPGAPPVGAPPIDDGRVVSAPPATMTASDGATLAVSAQDEIQQPVAPLTTAISTREYDVGGVFRGSVTGASEPAKGLFEVGYQIGCGIDMGTGPGVLIGGNAGGNAALGVIGVPAGEQTGTGGGFLVPNIGVTGGGSVTVSLKPGVVNAVPVTKKQYKGESPRVSIRNFRMRIDGCVGESFIRSYAILTRSTDQRETALAWYGESKKV